MKGYNEEAWHSLSKNIRLLYHRKGRNSEGVCERGRKTEIDGELLYGPKTSLRHNASLFRALSHPWRGSTQKMAACVHCLLDALPLADALRDSPNLFWLRDCKTVSYSVGYRNMISQRLRVSGSNHVICLHPRIACFLVINVYTGASCVERNLWLPALAEVNM